MSEMRKDLPQMNSNIPNVNLSITNMIYQRLVLPNVLWFPMFRASNRVFGVSMHTNYKRVSPNGVFFGISSIKSKGLHSNCHLLVDLVWRLRAGGHVLPMLGEYPSPNVNKL